MRSRLLQLRPSRSCWGHPVVKTAPPNPWRQTLETSPQPKTARRFRLAHECSWPESYSPKYYFKIDLEPYEFSTLGPLEVTETMLGFTACTGQRKIYLSVLVTLHCWLRPDEIAGTYFRHKLGVLIAGTTRNKL